jgi:glycerol-3-phosphate acyltransferase PlsY
MVASTQTLLAGLLAYLVGSLPFGFILGKANGIDIRQHGSGNIGATNLTRTLGRNWGVGCFVLDFLKGLLPVAFLPLLFARGCGCLPALCAAATVLGHVFPVYLKFRGGKGVSTTLGALIALAFWPVVAGIATWVVVFKIGRYVSLASISAACAIPACALLLPGYDAWTRILLVAIAALIVVRHRKNIAALRAGTERRFGGKAK